MTTEEALHRLTLLTNAVTSLPCDTQVIGFCDFTSQMDAMPGLHLRDTEFCRIFSGHRATVDSINGTNERLSLVHNGVRYYAVRSINQTTVSKEITL